jgi:hypothetical protein
VIHAGHDSLAAPWIREYSMVLTKTHIALALGLAACQRGHRVRFTTAAALVSELIEARDQKKLLRFQKQIAAYELLIVDELGFVPLSKTGAELLFEMLSQRYERGSTMVTPPHIFGVRRPLFGLSTTAMNLYRRALHRPVRTEHAAVPRPRTQHRLAVLALIEKLAGGSRHDLPLCVAALRTCQHRFGNHIRHTFTTSRSKDNSDILGTPNEKAARKLPSCRTLRLQILDDCHVLCLPALGSFDGIELHRLTFRETFEATRLNCRKVYEDIFAILAADKAKSLCVVKPLHCSLFHDDAHSFVN